jgi:hypothetical protein
LRSDSRWNPFHVLVIQSDDWRTDFVILHRPNLPIDDVMR